MIASKLLCSIFHQVAKSYSPQTSSPFRHFFNHLLSTNHAPGKLGCRDECKPGPLSHAHCDGTCTKDDVPWRQAGCSMETGMEGARVRRKEGVRYSVGAGDCSENFLWLLWSELERRYAWENTQALWGGIPPGPRSSPKWCAMIWHWLKFFLGRGFPFPDFFNSWLLNLLVREEGFYNAFWLTRDSPMSVLTSAPCCQGSCSSKMRRVKFRGDWATSLSHKAGKEQSCLVSHI